MTNHSFIFKVIKLARKLNPQKRTKYLDAALNLFVTHGVQNTSTAAIAKLAGTAAGTLFLYFPTKQDLINELVMEIVKAQSDTIKAALTPTLSAQDSFCAVWESSRIREIRDRSGRQAHILFTEPRAHALWGREHMVI